MHQHKWTRTMSILLIVATGGSLSTLPAAAQQRENGKKRKTAARNTAPRQPRKPAPARANVPYGDHPRQVIDFWPAKTDAAAPLFVWIHGGGFRGGDKASIPGDLLARCLQAGICCASINYRLSGDAPYPAPMADSARAIQFLRSKAAPWNIDPKRVAAGGGSAGSGISQWIGYQDEMAQSHSSDPVARQSTRLSCVLPINMQSTYDPREIKRLIPGDAYKNSALVPFFGRPEGWDWDTDKIDAALDALLKDASPINHLTADDPPAFILQNERSNTPGNIHHPNFAKHLKGAMDKLHIECIFHFNADYDSITDAYADMVKFMQKHFGME